MLVNVLFLAGHNLPLFTIFIVATLTDRDEQEV